MSKMPSFWYRSLLNTVMSRKSILCSELDIVNLIVLSWALRCCSRSSSWVAMPGKRVRISSMYLSHRSGWVPLQLFRAAASNLPMNKFAQVVATGVPMAMPFSCLKVFPANWKVLLARIIFSISLNMVLRLWLWLTGGSVGMVCCNAMVIPTPWGMHGCNALTSSETSSSDFLASCGTCNCSMILMTSVDDLTNEGTMCRYLLR